MWNCRAWKMQYELAQEMKTEIVKSDLAKLAGRPESKEPRKLESVRMKAPTICYAFISCRRVLVQATIVLLFMPVALFSQGTAVVSGRILRAADNSPIGFASV